mmetsp:Transcript_25061/g.57589  ORF Transcript_25061/g.57589 Transcript_25061/m.57589 type:complete len:95 (-) Transcript_25061:353-637(-)
MIHSYCLTRHSPPVKDDDGGQAMKWAFSIVYMRAVLPKAWSSPPRIMFPASQFNGDSASGSDKSANTARQAAWRPHAGDHSFFRMSRQISPLRK